MFLNKSFPYTTSSRIHFIIGITLGFLILFILFFLKPFDSGNSNFPFKNLYFVVFGLIVFTNYTVIHLLSIIYYRKVQIWKYFEEILFCLVFIVTTIIIAFFYTEIIINKNPERVNLNYFLGWFKSIFLGFGILLFIPTILLRKQYTGTNTENNEKEESIINFKEITISGSLKKDSLIVSKGNLVYIKSENNYLSIFYFEEKVLKEKLLRSTLMHVKKQLPSFIKVHRSYIVNPNFFSSIKGNKQNAKLYLKRVDSSIPISKPFFEKVNQLLINTK